MYIYVCTISGRLESKPRYGTTCTQCYLHIKLMFLLIYSQHKPVSVLSPHRETSSVVMNYKTRGTHCEYSKAMPTAMNTRAKNVYMQASTLVIDDLR